MPTFVIDSAALSRNMEKLRRFTSAQIIAVVKGNGYGLGLVSYARFLTAQGVALLAVSTVEEAAALRDAGITAQLLMLSSTALPEEIAALLTRDVILTVGSADAARAVSDAAAVRGVTARVHVKLDTGMGRYGFLPQETAEAAALLQALPALQVEGVFTHLSDAANAKCTALQYRRFTEGVRILQEAGIDTGLRHVCASTAFLRYPEMHLDAVRLGSALLGRLSVPDTLGLERIGWLEAQVTELKTLPAGWPVGYTGAYRTRRETRLALLPVGYTSGVGVTEETNALRLQDRLRRVLHTGRRLLRADGLTVLVNALLKSFRKIRRTQWTSNLRSEVRSAFPGKVSVYRYIRFSHEVLPSARWRW